MHRTPPHTHSALRFHIEVAIDDDAFKVQAALGSSFQRGMCDPMTDVRPPVSISLPVHTQSPFPACVTRRALTRRPARRSSTRAHHRGPADLRAGRAYAQDLLRDGCAAGVAWREQQCNWGVQYQMKMHLCACDAGYLAAAIDYQRQGTNDAASLTHRTTSPGQGGCCRHPRTGAEE
eukprot:1151862-Pelagomonas_calceolata.AAC.4